MCTDVNFINYLRAARECGHQLHLVLITNIVHAGHYPTVNSAIMRVKPDKT